MGRIDYHQARQVLTSGLNLAKGAFAQAIPPTTDSSLIPCFDAIFASRTQAYREVLLGCLLARIVDREIDIRLPYLSQGPRAFPGRDLDEKVVNPLLRANQIPCSKGPYLNVFRRQVKFDEATREGLRDKPGYDAFLCLLDRIEAEQSEERLREMLVYLLYRFILLQEERSAIRPAKVHRLSLPQYRILLQCLLQTPSGGRLPVLLVSSLLHAIRETFELDWDIQCQDINVSDHASSASGDITIGRGDDILMVIEVTQRPVDEARILSTFMTKIAPAGIRDYLFLVNLDLIGDDAKRRAERYFAQGHDVNFLDLEDWILNSLATIGQPGRNAFSEHLHAMLSAPGIPQYVIVAWNSAIDEVTSA